MARRRHYIEVSSSVRSFLAKAFAVDKKTVQNALTYVSDSPLALRIRSLALQKGGVEMLAMPVDELEKGGRGTASAYQTSKAVSGKRP